MFFVLFCFVFCFVFSFNQKLTLSIKQIELDDWKSKIRFALMNDFK